MPNFTQDDVNLLNDIINTDYDGMGLDYWVGFEAEERLQDLRDRVVGQAMIILVYDESTEPEAGSLLPEVSDRPECDEGSQGHRVCSPPGTGPETVGEC